VISTPFASAPAGVLGSGSVDARPYACAAALPSLMAPVAGFRGTGVPTVGTRLRVEGMPATGTPAALQQHDPITPNDGTTPLGIHSPGRPKS
jgi:hypothetical protein